MRGVHCGRVRAGLVAGLAVAVVGVWVGAGPSRATPLPGEPDGIVDGRIPDTDALHTLLVSLGYSPEDIGQGNWRIKHKRGEWELSIDLQVSADASMVWVRCYIGTLQNPETYEARHYLDLIAMQGRVSPRFFFTTPVEGGTGLFYCRGLDNRALTGAIVDAEIAALQETMAGSIALWNYNGWTRAGAAPPAEPPAAQPADGADGADNRAGDRPARRPKD